MLDLNTLVNNFAVRSFRDVADADYIAARMACRAALVTQFLWAGQQAVEKYLKCILLLNRIPAAEVKHDLNKALEKVEKSGLALDLTDRTREFIYMLGGYGPYRYLEVSNIGFGADLVTLDRAVWELRRFCTLDTEPRNMKLRDRVATPRVRISGGYLETIIDNKNEMAREALIWQNGFFGKRARKSVRVKTWFKAHNAPLYLNPHLLDEILKYVYLPKHIQASYRSQIGKQDT